MEENVLCSRERRLGWGKFLAADAGQVLVERHATPLYVLVTETVLMKEHVIRILEYAHASILLLQDQIVE